MKIRMTRRGCVFGLVAGAGVLLLAWEVYALSPGVRTGAVPLLERAGAYDRLAGMLSDEDVDVRQAALEALVRAGGPAVPALTRELDAPDPVGRSLAAAALGGIGPPAAGAAPALHRLMLTDGDAGMREQAANAYGRVVRDDPAAVTDLITLLETGDEAGRAGAAEALGAVGEPAVRAVPALARALADPSPEVRAEAAENLGRFGPNARVAVPALIATLADSDSEVRGEARASLGRIVQVLGPEDAGLRDQAAAALAKPMPKGP